MFVERSGLESEGGIVYLAESLENFFSTLGFSMEWALQRTHNPYDFRSRLWGNYVDGDYQGFVTMADGKSPHHSHHRAI